MRDDPLGPARGLVVGLLGGMFVWLLIVVIAWAITR